MHECTSTGPELRGRGWLNTGGRDLKLADLRGKIVLADFWTFCCINCLHVLDELRPLEEKYGDVLVVIGVHSPKFEHEKDADALAAAVERYGVHHPVLDDPELDMWQQYAARAWPTLSVIDPEGYVVATMAGEGHAEGLARLIDELIATHEAKGTLHRGSGPYVPPPAPETALRFPGKAVLLPDGNLLVSDSARHSLVEVGPDGETPIRRIGSGDRGRADGPAGAATFSEPQGLCLLPTHVAEVAGYDLVVADTVNHLLRGVRLETGEVVTVAGSGRQWRAEVDDHAHDAIAVDLSSRGTWPGTTTKSSSRWPASTSSGGSTRSSGPPACTPAPRSRRCATARWTRRGWLSRPGFPSRRTAPGSGSPTARAVPSGTSRTASWAPPSGRACSTSVTWMGRRSRRCSSIRWACAHCRTARC
ncbi:hypothetical protein GCM10027614_47510 [Micromonospora vulcania]